MGLVKGRMDEEREKLHKQNAGEQRREASMERGKKRKPGRITKNAQPAAGKTKAISINDRGKRSHGEERAKCTTKKTAATRRASEMERVKYQAPKMKNAEMHNREDGSTSARRRNGNGKEKDIHDEARGKTQNQDAAEQRRAEAKGREGKDKCIQDAEREKCATRKQHHSGEKHQREGAR